MKKHTRWMNGIFLVICAAVFFISTCILADRFIKQRQNDCRLAELSLLISKPQKEKSDLEESSGEDRGLTADKHDPQEARILAYQKVKEQNSDFIGWIKIEQTKIDYPVLQSLEHPNFYLDHDFDKNPSSYGAPYAAEECKLEQDCKNIVLYGHHMKNGSMFASLSGYQDKEFWESHPVIQFDTLEECGNYQVMAVFTVDASDEEHPLMQWIWTEDEEQFMHYVFYAKNQSIYNTGVMAEWGDHLLSLITCEYTHQDGRLIVVAKRIKDGRTESKT